MPPAFFTNASRPQRRKNCAWAFFGPSQSGKSYLISALARDAKGSLLADFGGKSYDFITQINPEGGKESTGLVTRFTTTPPEGLSEGFPIRLRLLTETDVARVLANTYYADCEHKEAPQPEALTAALDALEVRAAQSPVSAGALSGDDLEDLRDYINKNFSSRPRVQMLQKGFWLRAVELAPRLGLEDRAQLLGLIWDNVPQFQSLYLQLCGALRDLGNPAEAGCPIEALIPRKTSIIDVALLHGLSEPATDMLTILGTEGRKASLPRAVVTALTAEITIHMREKPDDFFDHTDLLDFPGYRSRLKLENLNQELERPGTLENLFLRGKVAYLFERYCEEKELTSMLLCIGPGNQEVQDLPRAVYEWICSTHGENPAHRAGKAPALFFVLTKMDMEFEKEKRARPPWKRAGPRACNPPFWTSSANSTTWPEKLGRQPSISIMSFCCANPNFRSEAIFSFDGDKESGIRPEQTLYVEEVRQAFLQSPLVQRHVAEPEIVWQAAMTLNDGGVALLRERLRPLCNPELKRRQITVSLDEKREQVLTKLTPFYKSDDREELRRRQEQLSHTLVALLARLAEKQLFGEFLRALQVRDFDLYEICFRAGQSPEQGAASVAPAPVVGARVSADDILGDIFGDAQAVSAASAIQEEDRARDTAAIFANLALEHWIGRLRDLAGDAEARNYFGLPAKELDQFCHELITAAARCKLRQNLETELRRSSAYSNMARERLVWKQVSLAADAINAFVDWLGFDPRFKDQAARTVLFGGKSVSLFNPPPVITGEPLSRKKNRPMTASGIRTGCGPWPTA